MESLSGPSETVVVPDRAAWTACEIIGRQLYMDFCSTGVL
jgi:hypothetical protein